MKAIGTERSKLKTERKNKFTAEHAESAEEEKVGG
jgi:hypothetical protein